MEREMHQWTVGPKSKNNRQKNKRGPILRVTATNSNDQIYECTNEEGMVAATEKSNLT